MDEFVAALDAEVGGKIDGCGWTCTCGASAVEASERAAALGLYFHRRSGHQEVTVDVE